jgi:signal transduction histidine kinase
MEKIMSALVADRVCGKDLSTRSLVETEPRRGLGSAIANNASKCTGPPDLDVSEAEIRRRGFLAHELRNYLQTAMLVTQVMKSTSCCGGTLGTLERSLQGLRDMIDRSLSEVRLGAGIHYKERIRVASLIEEMELVASMEATHRGIQFDVERGDPELMIDADRQFLECAISNLLQNAFKFTRPASHVWLRTTSRGGSLSIEIEDECGGLPPGAIEALFQPFEQRGADRSGLGLGLTISRQAVEANGGKISARDIPGKGCIFTIEMPLASTFEATGPG